MGSAAYQAQRSQGYIDKGLCGVCGKLPVVPNQRKCVSCKEQDRVAVKRYREAHRDYYNKLHKEKNKRIKAVVIAGYGGRCECCSTTYFDLLTIDHIYGGGGEHRKSMTGIKFYKWLIKNNFPAGFRILCWNCNMAAYMYGGNCPYHKENTNA